MIEICLLLIIWFCVRIFCHLFLRHSRLNEGLLNKQDCWDNVPAIIEEHVNKLHIYEAIKKEEDPAALKCYSQNLTDLEFRLQELWGFPKDAKFHKFWWTPKCLCPKADGEDSWGTGYTYINGECPLHA